FPEQRKRYTRRLAALHKLGLQIVRGLVARGCHGNSLNQLAGLRRGDRNPSPCDNISICGNKIQMGRNSIGHVTVQTDSRYFLLRVETADSWLSARFGRMYRSLQNRPDEAA